MILIVISFVRFRIPKILSSISLKAWLASDSSDFVLLKELVYSAIYLYRFSYYAQHSPLDSQSDIHTHGSIGFSRELNIAFGLGFLLSQCCDCLFRIYVS